jgi:MoaA/NifB/PqqE/SkfB family radical SAM enzyme
MVKEENNPLHRYQQGNEWKAAFSYIRSKMGWKGIGLLARIAISSINPYLGWQPGRGPLYAGWDLSYECNARCVRCGRWKENNHDKAALSTEEICRMARELKGAGVRFVCLAGGEPLLIEDLPDIIRFMKRLGLITSLCTNGVLLAERAEALVTCGLDHMVVSMDGDAPAHDHLRGVKGFFRLAEKGIDSVIQKRRDGQPTVSVRMLLHEDNIDKISRLVSRWDRVVDGIFLQPLHNGAHNLYALHNGLRTLVSTSKLRSILRMVGLDVNFYNSLMVDYLENPERFRRMPCLAGHWVVRIAPDGDVYPCVEQLELVGNMRQQSFTEIWRGTRFNCVREQLARQKNCSCFYNDMFMNVYLWKAHEKLPVLRQILHSRLTS